MTGLNLRSFTLAGLVAAGALLMTASGASATPAAGSIAGSGISDIIRDASQVTKVRRRGHRGRRHGRRFRHRYRSGPFIGFGAPYYYGGYPYGYYNDYYYRPRVRRSRRGSRSCRRAHRACVRNWGYGGGNYAGCMKYEGCRQR